MPTINNYIFSDVTYVIEENADIATAVGASFATLTISPASGFTIDANDFSIDPSFSNTYVSSVTFAQSGVNVICTINFVPGITMPSANVSIPLCVVGQGVMARVTIQGTVTAVVGSNVNGDGNETNTNYSNDGVFGETELLFSRTYNADTGYYFGSTPSCNVTEGNQSNYNIVQTPTYNGDNQLTNITFDVNYVYPSSNVSGDRINIRVPSAKEIYVAPQVITSYVFDVSNAPAIGTTRVLKVYGDSGAVYSVVMTDSLGNTYNIETNVTMGDSGVRSALVDFPDISAGAVNVTYTITISGDLSANFNQDNPFTVLQIIKTYWPKITIDAASTDGITGFSPVITQGTPFFKPKEQYIEVEWDLTVSTGTINYLNNITIGDFSNTLPVADGAQVSGDVTNSSTVTLDATYSNIQVNDKFNLYQGEISKAPFQFNITNVAGAVLTVSPNITVDNGEDIFIFRNNGNVISSPIVTATQTDSSTINFKLSVQIDSFGDADATFTLDLDEIINYATPVACAGTVAAGSSGVSDYTVDLDPAGGMVAYLIDPLGVPDKFEIIHGLASGDKKATSSMTAANNSGPFDNAWGTEPINDIPTSAQVANIDQFIGTNKGTIPTKQTEFNTDTGFTVSNMTVGSTTYKQIVWWEYTAADYTENSIATLRVTGPSGTGWNILRLCCPDANCT